MRTSRIVLTPLLCLSLGCSPKPPAPVGGKTAAAQKTKQIPAALSRSPAFRGLLERIPARTSDRTRGVLAISSWSRALALNKSVLQQVGRGSKSNFDILIETFIDRELHEEDVLLPRTAKQLSSWGIADGPAALYGVSAREPLMYYGVSNKKRFQAAWQSFYGGGSWTEIEHQGRTMSVLEFQGRNRIYCVHASRRQAVCCPDQQRLSGALEASGHRSLWSVLDVATQHRIDGGKPPDGVGWFAARHLTATALLKIDDGGISLDTRVGGRLVDRVLTQVSSPRPQSSLLDRYRALTQDRVFVRVPALLVSRLGSQLTSILPAGASSWLTGEMLLVQATAMPSVVFGVQDPGIAHKAIAALVSLLPRSSGGRLTAHAKKIGTHTAAVIENRASGSGIKGLPRRFLVAAVGSSLLVGVEAGFQQQLRLLAGAKKTEAPSWPALGANDEPIVAAELAIDDPLVGIWPLIQSSLSKVTLGKQLLPAIALGRHLAAQLYDARLVVSTATGSLKASMRVRSRNRGTDADKRADDLWHRAVTARTTGDLAGYERLSKQIAARFPKSRYAAALQRPPTLLAALAGFQAAIAVPAFARYQRRVATIEPVESLDKLKLGARAYFQADHYDKNAILQKKRFPKGRTGWVPAIPCCKQPAQKCQPKASNWRKAPWQQMRFSLTDPHRYQYRYRATGTNRSAKVVLEARGDLDCDGKYSSYKVLGEIDAEWGTVFKGPIITDELE